jgi:hypothetical protein
MVWYLSKRIFLILLAAQILEMAIRMEKVSVDYVSLTLNIKTHKKGTHKIGFLLLLPKWKVVFRQDPKMPHHPLYWWEL